MKYSVANPPLTCMQTQSSCFKKTKPMKVQGVLWHSTGANNPWLKRYVQPSDDAADREQMLDLLGKNIYGNDWNHIVHSAGLNAWIGKLASGIVTTVQTMPWNYRPWGCGAGAKGSCNTGWIQFEICEDDLKDSSYFHKVYAEACELTAYLCCIFDIDPYGTVKVNGVNIPTILCHQDSYRFGFGSDHGDVLYWLPKYGKNMSIARDDVAALLRNNSQQSVAGKEEKEMVYYKTLEDVPSSYRQTIKKLVDIGVLKGTGGGVLNISEDMCRILTILNRLGKL